MKHYISLLTGLALMGCDEQVNTTRNETDLRALTVEVASLRTELEQVRTRSQQNQANIEDWEDDVDALWTIVSENQSRLADDLVTEDWITDAIAAGTGSLGELAERVDTLESTVAENSAAMTATAALAEKMTVNAGGDVVFSDTNVYIQNGTAATDELNGKGNLILGYSMPTDDDVRDGSHNLIIGDGHSWAGHSGLAVGERHSLNANYAVAAGGYGHQIGGEFGVAVGGQYNVTNGMYGGVFGGGFGLASGASSSVFGGGENTATGPFSAMVGGRLNVVSGDYATMAGGTMSATDDDGSTSVALLTELEETVETMAASIEALEVTTADSDAEHAVHADRIDVLEFIDLGHTEAIEENRSSIETAQAEILVLDGAIEETAAALGSVSDTVDEHGTHLEDLESRMSIADRLMALVSVDDRGDVVFEGTNLVVQNGSGASDEVNSTGNLILGYNAYDGEDRSGSHNIILGDHNSYSGTSGLVLGENHQLSGNGSAIVGGEDNLISSDRSVIVGGLNNDVSGSLGTALGGAHNTVTGTFAATLGGYENAATADYAAAGPGRENTASGIYSAAMGGGLNFATGDTSAVFGGYAIEAEDSFAMGSVTALEETLAAEQERLDAAIEDLGAVAEQTDELESRADTSESVDESQSTAITALQLVDDATKISLADSLADLTRLAATVETNHTEQESADALLRTSISDLEEEDAALTSLLSILSESVDDLDSEIAAVASDSETVDAQFETINGRVDDVEADITDLETDRDEANAFLSFVSISDDGDLIFSDTNLHLRNGSGDSTTANGKGNLVLGYNGTESFAEERTGSHNLILGDEHHYTATGGIVTGEDSELTADNAVILGGSEHTAAAAGSVIIGGTGHQTDMTDAVIAGGQFNTATGGWSTIIGGSHNTASGTRSAVFGGHTNTASAEQSVVLGGYDNEASGSHALALGGQETLADAAHAVAPINAMQNAISDLETFTATLDSDVAADIASNTSRIDDIESGMTDIEAAAGSNTETLETHATYIAGLQVKADTFEAGIETLEAEDLDLWAGIDDLDTSRDVADNFLSYVDVSSTGDIVFENTNLVVRNGTGTTDGDTNGKGNIVIGYNEIDEDSGRTGSHNLVLGTAHTYSSFGGIIAGHNNVQLGESSSILGGTGNTTNGDLTVIVAGQSNVTNGNYSVVVSGHSNDSDGASSVVVAGMSNIASGLYSSIVSGNANDTTAPYTVVVGGGSNEASANSSVVVGGQMNQADGNASAILAGKSNVTSGSTSAIVAGWLNRTGAQHAAVLSGYDNDSSGDYSAVGGGFKNEASHTGSWVAGEYIDSTGLYTVDH